MQRPGRIIGGHAYFLVTRPSRGARTQIVLGPAQKAAGGRRENRPPCPATNAFPRFCTSPAKASAAACFPAILAPNRGWEIGGGRATRQPGQVRKEAALTRSGSGRSSVSYFFQAGRAKHACPAPDFAHPRVPQS